MSPNNNQICTACGFQIEDSTTGPLTTYLPPSSDAQSLSETNNVPSIAARKEYQEKLAPLDSRMQELRTQISHLENNLHTLREEYDRLNGYAETYKKILHPIRSLPDDVLLDIFRACVDFGHVMQFFQEEDDEPWPVDGGTIHPADSLDPATPPWTLSQVCRAWRVVALSSSSLWSYVGVVIPEPSSRPINAKVRRLVTQMQRAGNRLTVSLRCEPDAFGWDETHPLLVAICSHSARWECLRVNFGDHTPYGLQCVSALVRGNLPCLRRLALETTSNPRFDEDLVVDGFEFAPNLCDLLIVGPTADLTDVVRIPWNQITRYRGFTCDRPQVVPTGQRKDFAMLNCMSNLEALFWQHIMPEPWSNPSPIRLSFLHTLSLFQDYDPDFRLFFHSLLEWLTCDSLRILRFQGYQDTLPVLKNFLGRCSSTLQELWINTGDLQSTHVVELLEYVPDLVSLSILGAEPELFFALTKSNDDGTAQLLPRLREMRIYDQVKIDDVAPLVGMVESRVRLPGSYLKVVGVDKYALNILEDVQQRTDEWASWGITVKIFDGVWFFLTAELH